LLRHKVQEERKYDYEATKGDIQFLAGFKGPPFAVEDFEKLINLLEKLNWVNVEETEVKPFPFFMSAIETLPIKQSMSDIESAYNYWKKARESRGGKSLIRKYCKPPDLTDNDPKVIFRSLKLKKKNPKNKKLDPDILLKVVLLCTS
jgi:hypothetical protein